MAPSHKEHTRGMGIRAVEWHVLRVLAQLLANLTSLLPYFHSFNRNEQSTLLHANTQQQRRTTKSSQEELISNTGG